MQRIAFLLAAGTLSLLPPTPATAADPAIDYPGFVRLAEDVGASREGRLLSLAEFRAMAANGEALLLDARSAADFEAGHIEGAVNLPLPEFTDASLAEAIGPDRDRPILIYCNNNFSNDVAPVILKRLELALNILTFINLHGYGYANVYELGEMVDFTEPRVGWVSGAAEG